MTSRASIQRNFNVVTSNICIVKAYQTIRVRNLEKHDYYRPPTKLLEGSVFTGVQGWVGISGFMSFLWEVSLVPLPFLGVGMGMYKGVGYVQGVSTHHLGRGTSGGWVCPGDTHPPDTAFNRIQSQAGGTHPTGMLSCSYSNLCPIYL